MARLCPSACGRLATAAVFICVGIVQVMAGIILLKSDYAYMLSGPNIWTAVSNITVGVLLGVASTVWKRINKDSNKHANRRKFLAALVGSIFILNSTTAAMLIVSKGNNLLAIDLETGGVYTAKTLSKEILAYAYATSVCSPIVCVVVSVAFLTGICFQRKHKNIKTLEINNILNEDDLQRYDWVYTSNVPKPDPGILKTALSSEYESSSSESDDSSDSSSNLPVPLHLRSRSSLSDVKNSYHGSLANCSLPFSATRNRISDDSVSSNFGKIRSIPRLNNSSLIKTPARSYNESVNESINSCRSVGSGRRLMPATVAYRSDIKPGTPKRVEELRMIGKPPNSPSFEYSALFSPNPKTKLSFSLVNESSDYISKRANDGPSTSRQSSMEDSIDCEDSVLGLADTKTNIYSPNSHSIIYRTSTTDQTKIPQELKDLDNSAIQSDTGVSAFKELYLGDVSPEEKDGEKLSATCPVTFRTHEESFQSKGNVSMFVRDSPLRRKISSKLVPTVGPVVKDSCSFYKTSNRKTRKGRVKPYSKNSYDKYLQTGFSSFKDGGQLDEVDAMTHPTKLNNSLNKSLVTSISEHPTEEESDSFLPSTSTHTSGYMSASFEDDEEIDPKPNSSRQQPSTAQKLIAAEIKERYRKKVGKVSFESDTGSFQKDKLKNTKQLKIESQIAVSKGEILSLV